MKAFPVSLNVPIQPSLRFKTIQLTDFDAEFTEADLSKEAPRALFENSDPPPNGLCFSEQIRLLQRDSRNGHS